MGSIAPGNVHRVCILALTIAVSLGGPAPATTITEIMYNHPAGEDLEWVELYNEETTPEDLSGYRFAEGIRFIFPEGLRLDPGEYIVVARDPRLFAAHYDGWEEDDPRLFGPYSGRLNDDGERLTLENDAWELDESRGDWDGGDFYGPDGWTRDGYPGCALQSVRYRDRDPWPAQADGTGHSLARVSPHRDVADPANWAPSLGMDGTPGEPNGFETGYVDTVILAQGEVWKYFRGLSEPSDPIDAWREFTFDDAPWLEGQAGFGYGNRKCGERTTPDYRTQLDMRNQYISLYIRKVFDVADPEAVEALILRVNYDDGFVAYLNGTEVARAGIEGDPVAFDTRARSHEGGCFEDFDITKSKGLVVPGENILAIQGHNASIGSSDFSLDVYLVSRSFIEASSGLGPVVVNEIAVDDPEMVEEGKVYVELYNRTSARIDLSGYWLSTWADHLDLWQIPDGTRIPAKGFLLVRSSEFPASAAFLKDLARLYLQTDDEVSVFLTVPDGSRVSAAAKAALYRPPAGARPPGMEATHVYGRFPDGSSSWCELSERTPGAANRVDTVTDLVINEIMYHPFWRENPFEPLDDETNPPSNDFEYLELVNRGSEAIPLEGMHFVDGIDYAFPPGQSIAPGAYLVIAKNPERIEEHYGLTGVLGPYENDTVLADDGERLAIADARGNIVDEVHYYDSGQWSRWADGLGSSLELIDPRNDNGTASAWKASDESGKSEWAEISYQGRPAGGDSEFHMFLLGKGEMLIDDIEMVYQGTNYIRNGTFDTNTATWVIEGTHKDSHWTDEDPQGPCLKVVATNRGDTRNNRLECDTSPTLRTGRTYDIRYRARWLRGFNRFLTRTFRHGAAYAAEIPVPERLGSPGAPNSVAVPNGGPVMDGLRQLPILPGAGTEVLVTVRVSDADGVAAVRLLHKEDRASDWETVSMADDGLHGDGDADDGIYGGHIPAHASGRQVQFYVEAEDTRGALGVCPIGAPARAAIYQVGLRPKPSRTLQTFRVILAYADHQYFYSRRPMCNDLVYGTFILGDEQMTYNIGFRSSASPWIRPGNRDAGFKMRFWDDEPLYGQWRNLKLDSTRNDGTLQHDWVYYQMLRVLNRHTPYMRAPYCVSEWVNLEYRGATKGLYENRQKVGGEFVRFWFPHDPEGTLFKVDDWFEASGDGNPSMQATANMAYRGENKEAYRWFFKIRTNEKTDNYDPLIRLCYFMDQGRTRNPEFDAEAESWIDINEWLACLACSFYIADWDTLGIRDRGKNSYLYIPAWERRCKYIPWDKDLTFGDTNFQTLPGGQFPHVGRMCNRPWVQRRLYANYLFLASTGPDFYGPATSQFMGPWVDANYAVIGPAGAQNPSSIKGFLSTRANTIRSRVPRRGFRITTNSGDDFITTDETVTLTGEAPIDADLVVLENDALPGSGEILYACGGDHNHSGRLEWTSSYRWRLELTRREPGAFEGDLEWGVNELTFACYRRWQVPGIDEPFDGAQIAITVPPVPVPVITGLDPASVLQDGRENVQAQGPATVTIQGQDLPDAGTSGGVFLGGERIDDADVEYVSSEEIRFTAPSHDPGTVEVCVRTIADVGGSQVELPGCFTGLEYRVPPSPQIVEILPVVGPDVGCEEILIQGQNLLEGIRIFFGDVESPSVAWMTEMAVRAVLPASASAPTVVDVCAENPDGGRGCLEAVFLYMAAPPPSIASVEPPSGPPGTEVTIRGANFAITGSTVLFGGVEAEISQASCDELVVRAPEGTGVVDVTVRTPIGNEGRAPGAFRYSGGGPVLFIRGDVDRDGVHGIGDAILTLNYLFGGQAITCVDAADVDDDGIITLGDAVRLLNYLFTGGQPPPAPFPDPGEDLSADDLDCRA